MIEVEVTMRGFSIELLAGEFGQEIRQKLIERLIDVVYSSAFFNAPCQTGNLAGSIFKEIGDSEAKITPMAPYTPYIVFGTASHTIRPRSASCLVFKAASGELVFTSLVRHRVTKPNPLLDRGCYGTDNSCQKPARSFKYVKWSVLQFKRPLSCLELSFLNILFKQLMPYQMNR